MWRFKEFGKIILGIVISFIITSFISSYFSTPKIFNTKKLINNGKKILAGIPDLFRINLSSSSADLLPQKQWGKKPDSVQETPISITPTTTIKGSENPTPTTIVQTPNLGVSTKPIPTNQPQPTKIPKPTKAPDVFPIDPSLVRPGKTTDEVFEIAAQKTCVPKEVLKSIAYIESGEFFSVVSPKYFLLYNSYNWWNSQFLTDSKRACGGYDFDNGSGLVEADSLFAGYQCHGDGSTGAQSYIFGPMQINGSEQGKHGPTAAKLLGVSKVDRRVILDAITIVGVITKINVQPTSCSN